MVIERSVLILGVTQAYRAAKAPVFDREIVGGVGRFLSGHDAFSMRIVFVFWVSEMGSLKN